MERKNSSKKEIIQYFIESDPRNRKITIIPMESEGITLHGKEETEHFIKMVREAQKEIGCGE